MFKDSLQQKEQVSVALQCAFCGKSVRINESHYCNNIEVKENEVICQENEKQTAILLPLLESVELCGIY